MDPHHHNRSRILCRFVVQHLSLSPHTNNPPVLLLVRLYRYRREFSRLVSARNTTRSRFLRLFLMCMVFLLLVVPYSIYPFALFVSETISTGYDADWQSLHGDRRQIIVKFPSGGSVHMDKWGQVVLGYVVFLLFGTGTDAHNTYKKMLLALGLGKIFPTLYDMRETGTSTPSSFISARTFTSSCVSKAKSYFSKGGSRFSSFGRSTFNDSVRSNSVALETLDKAHSQSISSTTPVLPERTSAASASFLKRLFTRRGQHQPILQLFSQRSTTFANDGKKAAVETVDGFSARAWASEAPASRHNSEPAGVVVFREVKLDEEARDNSEEGMVRKSADEWMLRP